MKLLVKASDRLLSVFAGSVDAGACVPENGQFCKCYGGYVYRFSCTGSCYKTTTRC
ncbi:MAG TPA: hypothetical protein VGX28_10075 [Frankiaceae bacterium]|nr:hypothetical protein [Frankiaceae bacterium]